jgi:hypothetical protein
MPSLERDMLVLLRRLLPHQAVGHRKVRLGTTHDGGYVLLDDFTGIDTAIGCGVGTNADFERDLAARDIAIKLFDHTVEAAPFPHPRFLFHRMAVMAKEPPDAPAVDLAGIARMFSLQPGAAILKIDIEGDEWALLRDAPREALRPYRQIVAELHWFEKAQDPQWRATAVAAVKNLTRDFAVVHVHANNHEPMLTFDGVRVPSVLEVSLASRRHYRLRPSGEQFPTALDTPNNSRQPDLWLGRFDYDDRLATRLWRRLRAGRRSWA